MTGYATKLKRKALKNYNYQLERIPKKVAFRDLTRQIATLWTSQREGRKTILTGYISLHLAKEDTYEKDVLLFIEDIRSKFSKLKIEEPRILEGLISFSCRCFSVVSDLDFYIPQEGACKVVSKEIKKESTTYERTVVCG